MPPALKPEESDYSDYFSDAMSIDEEPEDVVASLDTEFSREQARLALLEQKIEIAKVFCRTLLPKEPAYGFLLTILTKGRFDFERAKGVSRFDR
jgi:hypothetical protein